NKIYQNVFTSSRLNDLHISIKSKRYTLTKIKRTFNNILQEKTKNDKSSVKNISQLPDVRILAFNENRREIIKTIKNSSDIYIINKFSKTSFSMDDTVFKTLIDYDIKASNMYNLIYYKNNKELLKGPMDYYKSPTYIRTTK
ncbi:nucleotidyltransferase family protein, partial [Clostridium tertium]